jgi:Zn-dependent protease
VAHGYAAYFLGDPTAKLQGRLTLNPLKHIDIIGTIIVPLSLVLMHAGFMFGWAKPVPYNPYNLRNLRRSEFIIALAGPATNIFLALIFAGLFRMVSTFNLTNLAFVQALLLVVFINILLGIFNLMPVPPLDGSKLLFNILPTNLGHIRNALESYGLVIAIIFVFFVWNYISPVVNIVFIWLTGVK